MVKIGTLAGLGAAAFSLVTNNPATPQETAEKWAKEQRSQEISERDRRVDTEVRNTNEPKAK